MTNNQDRLIMGMAGSSNIHQFDIVSNLSGDYIFYLAKGTEDYLYQVNQLSVPSHGECALEGDHLYLLAIRTARYYKSNHTHLKGNYVLYESQFLPFLKIPKSGKYHLFEFSPMGLQYLGIHHLEKPDPIPFPLPSPLKRRKPKEKSVHSFIDELDAQFEDWIKKSKMKKS